MKEVWKKVNCYKNRKQSNKIPLEIGEWTARFHEKLTPPWVKNNTDLEIERVVAEDSSPLASNYLLKQNNNTAPGKDNITYSILAQLPLQAQQALLNIYNLIWSNKIPIPTEWQDYIVIPIQKPGKPQEHEDSYRPISLASCVMKTYERLIRNRLEHWAEQNDKLPFNQYGFRRSRSTQEAVSILISDILISFTKNKTISAVFVDIKGAYDNVIMEILHAQLVKIGIPQKMADNIISMYTNRQLYLKINDDIIGPRVASLGLPQGSILSPITSYIMHQILTKAFKNR
ncbi:hypothetical protein NQ317_011941 [Molorchus minor]|uniref:Reverse transcriptase domain-containing protein n=1 Tax=Molorchus minor TaxID=1323400 RepID=A0ABQ9JPQ0_9CUCU|nr:hypothetical protein NQ317_011941 [Molorchus minor]